MTERVIQAGVFNLTAWERISNPAAPVNIYIEGDGLAWLNKRTKSMNPTPPNPLTLRLAAADKSENVVYIARPCQYTGWINDGACPDRYWTNGRTAPEVISAYSQALDVLRKYYQVGSFNLIGYSGGAAVAALLAAERPDVLSLRTIAGNTNYTAFSKLHNVSPLDASINPIDVAAKLSHLPQQHFIGASDTIVPVAIFDSWKLASGDTACIQSSILPGATHEKGWAEKWPELLNMPLSCTPAAAVSGAIPMPASAPIATPAAAPAIVPEKAATTPVPAVTPASAPIAAPVVTPAAVPVEASPVVPGGMPGAAPAETPPAAPKEEPAPGPTPHAP